MAKTGRGPVGEDSYMIIRSSPRAGHNIYFGWPHLNLLLSSGVLVSVWPQRSFLPSGFSTACVPDTSRWARLVWGFFFSVVANGSGGGHYNRLGGPRAGFSRTRRNRWGSVFGYRGRRRCHSGSSCISNPRLGPERPLVDLIQKDR